MKISIKLLISIIFKLGIRCVTLSNTYVLKQYYIKANITLISALTYMNQTCKCTNNPLINIYILHPNHNFKINTKHSSFTQQNREDTKIK